MKAALDRLKKARVLDINQPVPTAEIKDLAVPLPDPARAKRQGEVWKWYQQTERGRRWFNRERPA